MIISKMLENGLKRVNWSFVNILYDLKTNYIATFIASPEDVSDNDWQHSVTIAINQRQEMHQIPRIQPQNFAYIGLLNKPY